MLEKTGIAYIKIAEIFKYRKNHNSFCDKAKLHQQVVNKTLPIAKAFYSSYSLFFSLTMLPVFLVI